MTVNQANIKNRRLSDEAVISFRRKLHTTGHLDLSVEAKNHNVCTSTIRHATEGLTYKHLNDKHKPWTGPITKTQQLRAPFKSNYTTIHLSAPGKWITKVDEWRVKQVPAPTRSEAIRLMVDKFFNPDLDL